MNRYRESCYLAHATSKLLFELRPDVFPEGYLTLVERLIWGLFYEELEAKRKAHRG